MANQQRLADNLNHYEANRHVVPRRGNALLQGIAICGRCGRRMGLHYAGPQAAILCISVAPTSINMAGRAARRCAPWASTPQSKDCCSKR
jgi:hypothetical protein